MLRSSRRWWLVAVPLGFAVVAGAVVLAISLLPTPTPPIVRTTASPSTGAEPESPSPTAEPTAAPPATLDLEWTETAAFGDESAMDVIDATTWADGIAAVGARYLGQIPATGLLPPTVSGVIWLSRDGQSWEDVTPPDVFDRIRLHEVYEAGDGSLIVVGETWRQGQAWPREHEPTEQFWRSADGRSWREIRSLLPAQRYVGAIERGPLGYVLRGLTLKRGEDGLLYFWQAEIWFSHDGFDWELARPPSVEEPYREFILDIDAGEDGFVAVGRVDAGFSGQSLTIASASGREWFPAEAPPRAGVWRVATQPAGWMIIAAGPESWGGGYREVLEEPQTSVWTSFSGIAWHQLGTFDLASINWDGAPCNEAVTDLQSAGGWLVVSVRLLCVAGTDTVEGFGSPRISLDGIDWQPLPIADLAFDLTTHEREETGLVIHAAIPSELGLVLAGQSNGQAAFWLGARR
jgi:hypothetical protein